MAIYRVTATPGQLAELQSLAAQGAVLLGPEEADGTCIVHCPTHSMILHVGREVVPVTPQDRIRIVPESPAPERLTVWDLLMADEP